MVSWCHFNTFRICLSVNFLKFPHGIFMVRLLIDQAHCLRDRKGTASASGHGSTDGPKGRERVRALVRDGLRTLCQAPRRRQWVPLLPPILGVLIDGGLVCRGLRVRAAALY